MIESAAGVPRLEALLHMNPDLLLKLSRGYVVSLDTDVREFAYTAGWEVLPYQPPHATKHGIKRAAMRLVSKLRKAALSSSSLTQRPKLFAIANRFHRFVNARVTRDLGARARSYETVLKEIVLKEASDSYDVYAFGAVCIAALATDPPANLTIHLL